MGFPSVQAANGADRGVVGNTTFETEDGRSILIRIKLFAYEYNGRNDPPGKF